MSSTAVTPELPPGQGAPAAPPTSWWRPLLLPLAFLAPAIFFLSVWIVYPTIATIVRSLYDDRGDSFVWLDNYERMFNDERVQTAIKNNVLWVLVVPFGVTAIGLVLRGAGRAHPVGIRIQDRNLHPPRNLDCSRSG